MEGYIRKINLNIKMYKILIIVFALLYPKTIIHFCTK